MAFLRNILHNSLPAFLFFLLSGSAAAQSFVDTNRIFSQYNAPSGCPAPCRFITTSLYRFAGDTLLDTLHYREILLSEDSAATWKVTGFARETPEGKVYFRKKYWGDSISNEGLTYDFSLLPGDTMYFFNPFLGNFHDTCVLVRLDTIEMFDSARKVFHMKSLTCQSICYGEEAWYEGIGSLTGLLLSGFGFNPWTGAVNFLLLASIPGPAQSIFSYVFITTTSSSTAIPTLTNVIITRPPCRNLQQIPQRSWSPPIP